MLVSFYVERASLKDGWRVRRGNSQLACFDDRGRAIAAAENFARVAAQSGEEAVVKVDERGLGQVTRRFAAGPRPLTPNV